MRPLCSKLPPWLPPALLAFFGFDLILLLGWFLLHEPGLFARP